MSITLITGVPGSGKTLYAIAKLLRPFVGDTVDQVLDGVTVKLPRTIFTNINGLLIDHEQIEGGGTWALDANKYWVYDGNEAALRNWQNWAKPGAVICFDEFQKFWPPRPNGSRGPPDIQALCTHRHIGVDFILITQNCMNVDRHILSLVDRHLHVRRVANMGMAVVYEWDHASKSLLYKNAMTKAPWRYDKNVFNLYKSAEVHTKQKRKIPGLVWFVAAGLAAAAYLVPSLQSRLVDRVNGKPLEVSKLAEPGQAKSGEKVTYVKDGIEYTVEKTVFPASGAASSPVSSAPAAPPAPVFAGCVASRNKCTCYDQSAIPVQVDPGVCSGLVASSSVVPKDQIQSFLSRVDELDSVTRLVSQGAADSSVLSFMASR